MFTYRYGRGSRFYIDVDSDGQCYLFGMGAGCKPEQITPSMVTAVVDHMASFASTVAMSQSFMEVYEESSGTSRDCTCVLPPSYTTLIPALEYFKPTEEEKRDPDLSFDFLVESCGVCRGVRGMLG